MTVSRNAPCPCGSGRKYKHCCMDKDRQKTAEQTISPEIKAAAAAAPHWEADLLPFPEVPGDRPRATVVMSMVVAGGLTLHSEAFDHPGSEPAEVASALAVQLRAAALAVGATPARVRVGDEEVAALLAPLLREDGVRAVESGPLPQVAATGRSLFRRVHGEEAWPPTGVHETWRRWGRPGAEVAALFRAAAAFYRAAPWKVAHGEHPIGAWMPSGRQWIIDLMGPTGAEFVLALYSQMTDYLRVLEYDAPGTWERQKGRVYGMVFTHGGALRRPMHKEVSAAGWEVASPSAYPVLMSLRSPAGGICHQDWADLVALLNALPRFLADGMGLSSPATAAVDPVSGISFLLLPDLGAGAPVDRALALHLGLVAGDRG
ncbi:MAG: SEC-C domain-containing protein [Longimicrobiales bacterium]|nr:SEC-C domain-containing protein [Longimicrobiales bacterium]